MSTLFDNLSRMIAVPMSRRQTLRFISSAFIAGTFSLQYGCKWLKSSKTEKFNTAETAAKLRVAYMARDNFTYRLEVFAAFLMFRRADLKALLRIFNELIADIRKNGADGIETLVLACSDGIATLGSAESKRLAQVSLASLKNKIKFLSPVTPPNMFVPLGRISSILVLNVRADAIRTLLQSLAGSGLRSLMDLLDSDAAKSALCDQSPLKNQSGNTSQADIRKQENCDDHGSAGSKNEGTARGTLGRFLGSGCNLMTLSDLERLATMMRVREECFAKQEGREPIPNVAAGAAVVIPIVIAGVVAAVTVAKFVREWMRDSSQDKQQAAKEYGNAVKEAANAKAEVAGLEAKSKELESKINSLGTQIVANNIGIAAAQQDYRNAQANNDPAGMDAAKNKENGLKEENKELKDEKQKLEKEKRETDAKLKTAQVKEKNAAEDAEGKKPGFSDPEGYGKPSQACMDAASELHRQIVVKNWSGWSLPKRRPLDPVINPAPDSQPLDALGMQTCGADFQTLNKDPEKCNSVVECAGPLLLPDPDCGCEGHPGGEAQLAAKMATYACASVNCGPDSQAVAQGMVCVCGGAGEGGGTEPDEQPMPPRPLPITDVSVIAAVFGNGKAKITAEASPIFTDVRSIFEGLPSVQVRRAD